MSPTGEERRKAHVRRALQDVARGADGRWSEAKLLALVFKAVMIYVFLANTATILADWMVLAVFVVALIAPDLLKKLLAMRAPK